MYSVVVFSFLLFSPFSAPARPGWVNTNAFSSVFVCFFRGVLFVCSFQVADQKMLVVVEWEDFACRLACVNPAGSENKRQRSLSGSGELNLHRVRVFLCFLENFFWGGVKKSTKCRGKAKSRMLQIALTPPLPPFLLSL